MSFSLDLARFGKKALRNAGKIYRESAFDVFSSVTFSTPVDTGQLRGNWVATLGFPFTGEITTPDQAGSATINKIKAIVDGGTLRDSFVLTNNLPYALPIEMDGARAQGPGEMVRVNILRWPTIVTTNARKYGR